jgi:hypothetical protein
MAKPAANGAEFTAAEVRLIRAQALAGDLRVREWADVKGVSLETVRRVARRDTYRDVPDVEPAEHLPEPDVEAIAASLRKLQQAVNEVPPQPREINDLLDSIRKGEPLK